MGMRLISEPSAEYKKLVETLHAEAVGSTLSFGREWSLKLRLTTFRICVERPYVPGIEMAWKGIP
jgi:hypothetical protein